MEHGFFIWNNGNSFTIGKIWTGESFDMGYHWALYAQYEAGNFWATYHVHWGDWYASSGPSQRDLNFNRAYDAMGIVGSRWRVVSDYGY
jgi:hypothetical protein